MNKEELAKTIDCPLNDQDRKMIEVIKKYYPVPLDNADIAVLWKMLHRGGIRDLYVTARQCEQLVAKQAECHAIIQDADEKLNSYVIGHRRGIASHDQQKDRVL